MDAGKRSNPKKVNICLLFADDNNKIFSLQKTFELLKKLKEEKVSIDVAYCVFEEQENFQDIVGDFTRVMLLPTLGCFTMLRSA